MTRLAGRLVLTLLASLASAAIAQAADLTHPVASHETCGDAEIVTAYYKEQICYRGAAGGYAACKWVAREHQVRIPAACPLPVTEENAWPAGRGWTPAARGLVAKG